MWGVAFTACIIFSFLFSFQHMHTIFEGSGTSNMAWFTTLLLRALLLDGL
jgi:hypothetical protein